MKVDAAYIAKELLADPQIGPVLAKSKNVAVAVRYEGAHWQDLQAQVWVFTEN